MEYLRMKYICPNQIPKGRIGMRKIVSKIKNGYSIALMVDQRVSQGIKSNFFKKYLPPGNYREWSPLGQWYVASGREQKFLSPRGPKAAPHPFNTSEVGSGCVGMSIGQF